MDDRKYPVGTKIRFVSHGGMCYQARQDGGKIGEIIGTSGGKVRIHLPESVKSGGIWCTEWKSVVLLPKKNEQLLFDFAY